MTHPRRWVVAYTKHLKQKRKIYHDGVLELSDSGAKVFLYDDSEKLIDSRFLKKHEVIETGGTLTFEAHLVDIGNYEGKDVLLSKTDLKLNKKADTLQQKAFLQSITKAQFSVNSHVKGLNGTNCRNRAPTFEHKRSIFRRRPLQDPLSVMANNTEVSENEIDRLKAQQARDATQSDLKEWNVLYTTQIAQKAKKYHDGILRLLLCGSHMNQVVLLSEDGSILCSKYFKSAEFIKSGNKCELPNHLVEICEPRTDCKDRLQKIPSKPLTSTSSSNSKTELKKKVRTNHMGQTASSSNSAKSTEDLQKISSKPLMSSSLNNDIKAKETICKTPMEGVGSFISDSVKSADCNQVQSNKPLRDAYQILQTLKKLEGENNFTMHPVAQANASFSVNATNQSLNLQGDGTCKGNDSGCTVQASIPDLTSISSQKETHETKLEVDSLTVIYVDQPGCNITDPGSLSTNIQGVSADKCCSIVELGLSNGKEDTADASHNILKDNNSSDGGITMGSAATLNANEVRDKTNHPDLLQEETKGSYGMIDIFDGSSATHMEVENSESGSLSNENIILDDFPRFDLCF